MKVMLMDTKKLVNLVLPTEVFGNYWVQNAERENLVSIEANEGNWIIKSNSDVKVFRGGTVLTDAVLENEKFYTLKNVFNWNSLVMQQAKDSVLSLW